ncbi:MAG: hypothetical protein E4H36_02425 [Spirochaetales bacterium]|nr:MAG: hypothetical protein E4H36_02425 [Spirochaetales bacterium]
MKKINLVFMFFCFLLPLAAETFTFQSDTMSSVLAKGKERTLLSGNAYIRSKSTEIFAEEMEIYGENSRYALCKGNITVIDKEKGIILKSQKLYYDRDRDLSRIEGYAEMEDQKNELVAKGGFLENYGKDDIAIIQIGVRILKEDLACRSEFARYNRKTEILELSGMPHVFWKGDEYRASRIIINLDKDEIRLEGQVTGTVSGEEEKPQGPDPQETLHAGE